jgi:L-seryl-tRNA(Ser) seleniumtransferase
VELDLVSGTRATRGADALVALRQAVPDAGDVHVVNNGAAALVLAVTALARGRELVVSRGELVEIGDGFRIADLLESTGAHLREVGATNRTTLADYASGIGPQTGCVLKVHPSNFRITGFASDVAVRDLSTLTAPRHIPLVVDIGSGLLAPDAVLPEEPDAASTLRAGASLVIASGDKLLGGPQAGLLLGDAGLIHDLRRDPLARALRVDKLTLAALEATLLGPETPVAQALHADPAMLHSRAQAIAQATGTEVLPSDGAVGGGGAPGVVLPGWAVALPCELADVLRKGDPPVVGRVSKGRLLLDVRCVPPEMDGYLCTAIRDAFR